LQGGNKVQVP